MKRYLLFYGSAYYPEGGMNDFLGDFDTPEAAKAKLRERCGLQDRKQLLEDRWFQIWDTAERTEVLGAYRNDRMALKASAWEAALATL